MNPPILIFEITLKDVNPPIWRIVEVKQSSSLHDLHAVIQVAMGWTNSHLYSFSKGQGKNKIEFMLPDDDDSGELYSGNDPKKFVLKDIFIEIGNSIEYVYDWGDDWRHSVTFRGRSYEKAIFGYPCCVAGARCCPPEDVGGPPGYNVLLSAIAKKDKKLLKDYDTWLGYRFDPDEFETERTKVLFPKKVKSIAKR